MELLLVVLFEYLNVSGD